MKDYYTIAQVAKLCSVNRSTVHRWVTDGRITSFSTPGGHRRILPHDLEIFFKQNDFPIQLNTQKEKTRFLIVDDDPHVQILMKNVLNGPLIGIETASDGFEAGIKVVYFKPHLIILDLFMPNMDGFEVCKYLKQDIKTKDIKILIMTGEVTEENKKKVLSLGADAFLPKPSSKAVILKIVENLMMQ